MLNRIKAFVRTFLRGIKPAFYNYVLLFHKLRGEKIVVIECLAAGDVFYTLPIYSGLKHRHKIVLYYAVNFEHNTAPRNVLLGKGVPGHRIISLHLIKKLKFIDLYLSCNAFSGNRPVCRCIKVQNFHSLAMKNNVLTKEILDFDVLFFPTDMIRDLFSEEFIVKYPEAERIALFEVGYPKSDSLINPPKERSAILLELGLDPAKRTVIYAPTFDKCASLDNHGHSIISALLEFDINVLVKLHKCSYDRYYGEHLTRGRDWETELMQYEPYSNFRNILDFDANPYLVASDIMVSDAGGVGLEFKLMNKPVIYFDVPELFEIFGKNCIDYMIRDEGVVVKDIKALKEQLRLVLDRYDAYLKPSRILMKTVYNIGNATQVTAERIMSLLSASGARPDTMNKR